MKMTVLSKLRNAAVEQLQMFQALGVILNRPIDTTALIDLGTTLDNEARKTVERIVSGNTVRVRALRDMAALVPEAASKIDTRLYFTSLSDVPGYEGPTHSDPVRVYKLEMLRLMLMTFPEKNDAGGYCLDMDALVKQKRFLFRIFDWCKLMIALGELEYVTLDAEADVNTGQITVKRFICPSEEVDYALEAYDRQNRLRFNLTKMFDEFFGHTFNTAYAMMPTELDLGSYKDAFDNILAEKVQDNRRIIAHYGSKNNVGEYYCEHYIVRASGETRSLLRVENPNTDFPQREYISPHSVLPWMVAIMAMDMPEERNFLVQYDQEEKSVVIIPGDPYAEPDSLA